MIDHNTGPWYAHVDPDGVCFIRGHKTTVHGGDVARAVAVLGYRLTGEEPDRPFEGYASWPVQPANTPH